ncbi:tyrosine-type recombinase/integrase [Pseudomonas amygdali]|uniref:tyrosine-type recombinase/integrase n=1 Tax=Pseudomonas amygdali TaxID=47877 RepID=UPI0006E56CE9|nr:tyrosine-type recombinase/integrase [Pseudomonas amygdali]KPY55681.1 hypothetical protein ALO93_200051 [Pseudomonas amygdali pv. sesami]
MKPVQSILAPSNNRVQQAALNSVISAETDAEAIAVWLRAKGSRSINTFDSYQREASRLLLWLSEQDLRLGTMKVEDAHSFFKLLAFPPARWLRPKKTKKAEQLLPTQVFSSGLSNRSIAQTRTILSQLFAYLQDAGYLQRNVFRLTTKPQVLAATEHTRLLDLDGWDWLRSWIEHMPRKSRLDASHAIRCRWLFSLLYHTGIRRHEAAQARMGDFVRRNKSWALRVVGKGHKERFVTINSTLLAELVSYRVSLSLAEFPTPGEELPLIASVNGARLLKPMTPRAIGLIVTRVSAMASAQCPDPHVKAQIEHMTTHWLRHTNATHRLLAGASLETTQDELGHADPRTTRIYAKTSDAARLNDAEKLAALKPSG